MAHYVIMKFKKLKKAYLESLCEFYEPFIKAGVNPFMWCKEEYRTLSFSRVMMKKKNKPASLAQLARARDLFNKLIKI